MAGKVVALKDRLTRDQAAKYVRALETTHAVCRVEPCSPAHVDSPAPISPGDDATALQPSGRSEPLGASMVPTPPVVASAAAKMTCPGCGLEQESVAECVSCGLVVAKFREKPALPPVPEFSDAGVRTHEEIAADLVDQGYTPRFGSSAEIVDDDEGFFAPERRGLDRGMLGGAVMMLIAAVWFGLGWVAGFIFFYPPVLFVIGLFGLLKGMLAGNVAGHG